MATESDRERDRDGSRGNDYFRDGPSNDSAFDDREGNDRHYDNGNGDEERRGTYLNSQDSKD